MNDPWFCKRYIQQKQSELLEVAKQARLVKLAAQGREQTSPFPVRILSKLKSWLTAWGEQIRQPSRVATSPSARRAAREQS